MAWTFDTSINGLNERNKTMGGKHQDWPEVGKLPDSLYNQIDCGHITLEDLDIGDKIYAYTGNVPPVSTGKHPTKCYVYDLPPYHEKNFGKPRIINDGRFAAWKGQGAYGSPITVPTRPDFVVKIIEKNAGESIEYFNPPK